MTRRGGSVQVFRLVFLCRLRRRGCHQWARNGCQQRFFHQHDHDDHGNPAERLQRLMNDPEGGVF
jgi:hypothetical protein